MDALKIALAETPIHFTTSAIYYKLGCVELAMNNYDAAKLVLHFFAINFLSSS
jgi:hypothetical protein